MEPLELKNLIEEKLNKQIPSHIFLDKMRVLDEESRKASSYNDPKYIPFFYWLGTILKPKYLIEIGFKLGLFSGNFLRSCKSVEIFSAFQEESANFYSQRLGKSNVLDHYKGRLDIHVGLIYDFEEKINKIEWELALINEEVSYDKHREYLDTVWSNLSLDGFIAMDYILRHKPAGEAYNDFCRGKNRIPVVVDTRYGVGIIRK